MSIGARALFLSAILIAGAATTVSAASYTFDLQKIGSNHGDGDAGTMLNAYTLSVTQGDLTGTFTGKTLSGGSFDGSGILSGATTANAESVTRFHNGLGSYGGTADDEHTVDAITGTNDAANFIEMSFFESGSLVNVQLTQLVFGWVGEFPTCVNDCYPGSGGAFDLILDTVSGGIGNNDTLVFSGLAEDGTPFLPGDSAYSVDLSSILGLTDDTFGVLAGLSATEVPGSWKLRAVTVNTFDTPPPPPIPLPAAGWLLIGGLGGLAALRRRR